MICTKLRTFLHNKFNNILGSISIPVKESEEGGVKLPQNVFRELSHIEIMNLFSNLCTDV